ncbi:hypothetical protein CGRA01v4_07075 [Colletotrichum graminicola]|nr:hypothetical protein CGRA01v4_07075 [Colletotrichum graminicola]
MKVSHLKQDKNKSIPLLTAQLNVPSLHFSAVSLVLLVYRRFTRAMA